MIAGFTRMGLGAQHAQPPASDGALPAEELVRLAKASGVSVLAVTDHDTLAGIPSAMAEGARVGLEIVPGVEVTAYADDLEGHILGHFIHPNDARLTEFLAVSRDDRIERIRRMIDKLWSLGLPLDAEEILKHAPGASVGRPHLAQAMVRRGYVGSVQEAFDRYLTAGGDAGGGGARNPPARGVAGGNEGG